MSEKNGMVTVDNQQKGLPWYTKLGFACGTVGDSIPYYLFYRQRSQVERLFRRIKRFRRIFTRYDKLDILFLAFLCFALVVDALM